MLSMRYTALCSSCLGHQIRISTGSHNQHQQTALVFIDRRTWSGSFRRRPRTKTRTLVPKRAKDDVPRAEPAVVRRPKSEAQLPSGWWRLGGIWGWGWGGATDWGERPAVWVAAAFPPHTTIIGPWRSTSVPTRFRLRRWDPKSLDGIRDSTLQVIRSQSVPHAS